MWLAHDRRFRNVIKISCAPEWGQMRWLGVSSLAGGTRHAAYSFSSLDVEGFVAKTWDREAEGCAVFF